MISRYRNILVSSDETYTAKQSIFLRFDCSWGSFFGVIGDCHLPLAGFEFTVELNTDGGLSVKVLAFVLLLPLLGFVSCATGSRAVSTTESRKTVNCIDIPRYMGRWFVIANIPTFIEKGSHNAIELYTWNEGKNRIDINFRFNKGFFEGKLKIYPQKAWINNMEMNAEWRIQPVWPLRFPYLVLDVGKEYEYTVIGVPNRKYIWIMSQEPEMDESLFASLVEKAQTRWGYKVSRIQ